LFHKLFWFYFFGRARICVCYNHGNNEKKKESGSKYLDIYGGGNTATKKKPVLIFVPGGTWQIHARYYAMPLGRALSPLGILIVVPDYTRYSSAKSNSSGRRSSQGNTAASSKAAVITDMIQDIDNSIQWVFDHIEEYGGDKTKVALAGQSAGGHLVGLVGMLKLLDWVSLLKKRQLQQEQTNDETTETAVSAAEEATMKTAVTTAPTITMKETKYDEEETIIPTKITNTANFQQQPFLKSTYTPTQLLGYIPTSSPLDLLDLCPQFFHSGIVSPMKMNGLFGGICKDDGLDCWSPMHVMECCFNEYGSLLQQQQQHSRDDNNKHDNNDNQQPSATTKNDIFPRFAVIHGTSDHCVPIRTSEQFVFKYNNFYNNLCSGANNSGLLGEDESLHENHQNKAELITYEGWSHTDLIIERPMVSVFCVRLLMFACCCREEEEEEEEQQRLPLKYISSDN
jgi:hypothetical protein